MKLLVDQIQETPVLLTFEPDPDWCAAAVETLPDLGSDPDKPLRASLRTHLLGQDLFVEGEIEAEAELGCSRCLARYREPLRESFRLVLEPSGTRVPSEPEAAAALARNGMCLGDELEMGWFQGHEIDLGPFFLEVLALALPVKPLCREECRGLCPRCGVDRNEESCECEVEIHTSPFAALRALQGSAAEGDD